MAIRKERYRVYFNDKEIGEIAVDSLSVPINGRISTAEVDSKIGIAKAQFDGYAPAISFTLMEWDVDILRDILPDVGYQAGNDGAKIGFGIHDVDMDDQAGVLELIPVTNDPGVRTRSWYAPKAYIDPSQVNFDFGRDRWVQLPLSIGLLEDSSQPAGFEYLHYGNIDAEANTPLSTFITLSPRIVDVPMHYTAADIEPGQTYPSYGWRFDGADSGSGALINEATGYTASDTSLVFDTSTASNLFKAGQYIQIGTEVIYIESVTQSGTSGTLTVTRGVAGSTAAAISDNDAIDLLKNTSYVMATRVGTWAASASSNAKVGDTKGGTTETKKGHITHVAAGTSNITFTLDAVASPNLAITAN